MASRLVFWVGLLCAGLVVGCGEESVCDRAQDKINECRAAMNPPAGKLEFPDKCSDDVLMTGSAGPVTVALQSWSERYVECEIETQTCNCTTLGSWFDYKP